MSATAPPGTQVVTGELHRVRHGHGKRFSAEPPPGPSRRPARVALTLALAHMIQKAIDRGEIRDQADAAQKLDLTRARLTQIMNLTLLSPQLQEQILFLEAIDGIEPFSERGVRGVVRLVRWVEQEGKQPPGMGWPHSQNTPLPGRG